MRELFEGPEAFAAGRRCLYRPFEAVPEPFFPAVRQQPPQSASPAPSPSSRRPPHRARLGVAAGDTPRENVVRLLFRAMDECPANQELFAKAAGSGIEAALRAPPPSSPCRADARPAVDLWAQAKGQFVRSSID